MQYRVVTLAHIALLATLVFAAGCRTPFAEFCGDGTCSDSENPVGCPEDCAFCGDGLCILPETPLNCGADCGFCGDGVCGENEEDNCVDCPPGCGDGTCSATEDCLTCLPDCGPCTENCADGIDNDNDNDVDCDDSDCNCDCGDGMCDPSVGETCFGCSVDCGNCCGDGSCDAAFNETCDSCSNDCGDCCGDGKCDSLVGEDCDICVADCGVCCGDGFCSGATENPTNCPLDCDYCGDGFCAPSQLEDCSNCPGDCGTCCGNGMCEVGMGEDCTSCPTDCGLCCSEMPDQSDANNTSTSGTAPEYFGQSWTAGVTGMLTRIDVDGVFDTLGATSTMLEIYDQGVCVISPCGPLITAELHPFVAGPNSFVLAAPIPVIAGNQYTFRLYSGLSVSADIDTANTYAGGRMLAGASLDLLFTTYVTTCP